MSQSRFANGLTLIEVVVVLAILAVLAGVAVRSLEPIADQTRFEVTQRSLDVTEEAILRDARLPDGTRQISGFVSDIGRLPDSIANLVDETGMSTLARIDEFGNTVSVALSGFPVADRAGPIATDSNNPTNVDCSEVSIRCGWRGPYVTVSDPADGILDGWGRTIQLQAVETATQAEVRVEWPAVTTQYNNQVRIVEHQTVSGFIRDASASAVNAEVALVYPDPTKSVDSLAVMEDLDVANDRFRFEKVPVGTRALVFLQAGGTPEIRYIEVTPMQSLNLPITL
ncbi:MAG: prepilin-type N-terminal cleavage/methylation domain-containing protein [Planctomycetota bacterium]